MFGFLQCVLKAGVSRVSVETNVANREMGSRNVVRIGKSEVQASYSKLVEAVMLKEEACPSPADLLM